MIWTANAPWLPWLAYMAFAYVFFLVAKRFADNGRDIRLEQGNFGQEISLWQALLGFFGNPTASLFLILVIAMWGLRTYVADWSWLDLLVSAMVIVAWPMIEWLVHVRILHARPLKILGFNYDPLFAQIHRAHHRNPYHPKFGIVPVATLVQYCLLIPGIFCIFFRWPRPITVSAVVATMAFRYELWHYLIHSSYKPKSKWFRRLRDRHLWHHFQHEGYWFGITTKAGDILLGTNPNPKDVPLSRTARTLGHLDSLDSSQRTPSHQT